MLILDKTRNNILVNVHFLIPDFQILLIHINKVGNRINKVGHETKMAIILPTGQWYAPSAGIAWFCMVLHCIA